MFHGVQLLHHSSAKGRQKAVHKTILLYRSGKMSWSRHGHAQIMGAESPSVPRGLGSLSTDDTGKAPDTHQQAAVGCSVTSQTCSCCWDLPSFCRLCLKHAQERTHCFSAFSSYLPKSSSSLSFVMFCWLIQTSPRFEHVPEQGK